MHRRASTLLVILAAGSLLATACSGDDTAAPTTGGGETASTVPPAGASIQGNADSPASRPAGDPERLLKVAILAASGDTDPFAQAGLDGIRAASTEDGHIELAEITGPTVAEVPVVAQKLCDDRYDLVIGHGAEFVEPLVTVAAGCPATAFLTTNGAAAGHEPTANVDDWSPGASDVGYPVGLVAGTAAPPGTRFGIIAGPDGTADPAIVEAFRRGVADADPSASFASIVGVSGDVQAGRDAAASALGDGARFLFCAGGGLCPGVVQAADEAHVPVVTAMARVAADATSDVIVASTPLELGTLYRDAFHLVRQQRWGGTTFTSTIENQQVSIAVNADVRPDLVGVPVAELARVGDELVADVRAGAVKLSATA